MLTRTDRRRFPILIAAIATLAIAGAALGLLFSTVQAQTTNQPSEIRAYWTESETGGSNSQDSCASSEPFRAYWNPPEESRSLVGGREDGYIIIYKVADEWEAEITPKNGASNVSFTIQNATDTWSASDDDGEQPELTGTVDIDGLSTLSIRVRGRFGDDGWGDWSPVTGLFCNVGGL